MKALFLTLYLVTMGAFMGVCAVDGNWPMFWLVAACAVIGKFVLDDVDSPQ